MNEMKSCGRRRYWLLGLLFSAGLLALVNQRLDEGSAPEGRSQVPQVDEALDRGGEIAVLRAQVENLRNNLGELHRLRNQSQQWQGLAEEVRVLSNRLAKIEAAGGRGAQEAAGGDVANRVKESEAIVVLQGRLDEHLRNLAEEQEKADALRAGLAAKGAAVEDDPALRQAEEKLNGLKRIVESIHLRILQEKVDQTMVVEKDR